MTQDEFGKIAITLTMSADYTGMLRPLTSPYILFDAAFVLAIGRGFHEFATAYFFNNASAKALTN